MSGYSWSTAWLGLDRRRRGLALVVAAALVLAIGGWVTSLVIESPREAAANAAAPAPSLITVPVERRAVGEEIVTRGLVTATQTVEVVTDLAGKDAQRALVSGHVPKPGDEITGGSVVIEISGRPILALQADVPAYRDLRPGDTGPDVLRLNAALATAGLSANKESSAYDAATQQAVESLYRNAGYPSDGTLPAGEVAFVSALPASVVQVTATLGTSAAESSVKIASGALTVAATFSSGEAARVQPGAKVVISSELLGESVDATVKVAAAPEAANSAESPGTKDPATGAAATAGKDGVVPSDSAAKSMFQIVPDKPLSSQWAGQDVKVRVVSAVTDTEVLAVPVTAIVSNGSGDTEVVVVRKGATSVSDADPRRVAVTVGAVGGGWAEVTPGDGAELSEGDPVQLSASTQGG